MLPDRSFHGHEPLGDSTDDRAGHNRIGSLGQQLTTVATSIHLGERRGTSAAAEWDDAQQLVAPRCNPKDRQ